MYGRARAHFAWTAILLAAGCGQGAVPSPPAAPSTAPTTPTSTAEITGAWRWSHATEADRVRRVEVEHWHLRAERGAVHGTCERVVTFLAVDGIPFTCSQTLTYELHTTYRVTGSYRNRTLELSEVSYIARPSPCDDGYRTMAEYRGELRGDELVIGWPGGTQALTRTTETAATADEAAAPRAAGAWRWQTRDEQRGEIHVEVEEWDLAEDESGQISGTVTRTITVFDPQGHRYTCSGDTYYRYQDRYTIRGMRAGTALSLSEIAVEPERHPCLTYQERHLDTAVAELIGDYLVLTWRGQRRQVLHRPDPRS